jgi:hypothetical protein
VDEPLVLIDQVNESLFFRYRQGVPFVDEYVEGKKRKLQAKHMKYG